MPTHVLVIYSIATLINLVAIYLIFFKFNVDKIITIGNIATMLIILVIGPIASALLLLGILLACDDFVLFKWK